MTARDDGVNRTGEARMASTLELLSPVSSSMISGFSSPRDAYLVLLKPAPLAGMRHPSSLTPSAWRALASTGFHYVVCLTDDVPGYDPTPVVVLHAVHLKDLVGGGSPTNPHREESHIRNIAEKVLSTLSLGKGVIVHCAGGTGRTGTVIGCVLRGLGCSSSKVFHYFEELNAVRGKKRPVSGWPESEWQRELVERFV